MNHVSPIFFIVNYHNSSNLVWNRILVFYSFLFLNHGFRNQFLLRKKNLESPFLTFFIGHLFNIFFDMKKFFNLPRIMIIFSIYLFCDGQLRFPKLYLKGSKPVKFGNFLHFQCHIGIFYFQFILFVLIYVAYFKFIGRLAYIEITCWNWYDGGKNWWFTSLKSDLGWSQKASCLCKYVFFSFILYYLSLNIC